jgi:hypothetical protein
MTGRSGRDKPRFGKRYESLRCRRRFNARVTGYNIVRDDSGS